MGQSRGNRPPQDPTVQVVNKTDHESGRVFISKSPTVGDQDHLAFTTPIVRGPGSRYCTSSPVTARPMIMRWISEVPSKIVKIFASRCQRSTGYSRV